VECTDPRFRNLEIGASLLKEMRRGLAEAERRMAEAQAAGFRGKGKRKADQGLPPELDLGSGGEGAYPAGTILSSLDMTRTLPKTRYQKEVDLLQGRLHALHREARERGISMVLVFEGWDAAGKGGAIRRVLRPLDARDYRVISVAAPTDEERAHHYLWRFWRHMPRAGRVAVFDRSWYGRVLVERVERFATPREWMRAYGEINCFEGELLEHGMGLVKFWIHITAQEQEARFRARADSPLKSWKLTAEDWRNRERWGAYERAVNDMVEHTSTPLAPWTLIEGNDKRYARVRVLQEVCRRFEEVLDGKSGTRSGASPPRGRGRAGRTGR
jgi:polyphosphate kinase 2 (PPK2 family)